MIRKLLLQVIRDFHILLLKKPLPARIALYFHEIKHDELEKLEEIITFYINNGYNFVGPKEFIDSKKKVIFISFDDNYLSWIKVAELLAKKNIYATYFINTGPLRNIATISEINNYANRIKYTSELKTLSSEEIKHIYELGHIIGGHTHNHYNLNNMELSDAVVEIKINKQLLEDIIQTEITSFSFPYGMRRHFNTKLKNYCLEIGYKVICNATPGLLYSQQEINNIYRTPWHLNKSLNYNMENIQIDGRLFERITGRSAIG